MLTLADAHRLIGRHLGDTARARHSVLVGYIMRKLAKKMQTDALLWELSGLCHDLDFSAVGNDWTRHGVITAAWLVNDLPSEALEAIKAHDHRTGVNSDLPISHALRLADALAVICDLIPDAALLLASDPELTLHPQLASRAYLVPLLVKSAAALDLPLAHLAPILRGMPPPA